MTWRSLGLWALLPLTGVAIFDQIPTRAAAAPYVYTRYFADGATGSFFDTRFAIANPGTRAANVVLTFARTDGRLFTRAFAVAAASRTTISPASTPGLRSG